MNCKTCKKYMAEYLDGALSAERQADVAEHLEHCGECRAYHNDLLVIRRNIKTPEREAPDGFSEAWRAKVAAAAETAPQKKQFRYKAMIPVLAAGVCMVAILSIAVPRSLSPMQNQETVADAAMSEVYAAEEAMPEPEATEAAPEAAYDAEAGDAAPAGGSMAETAPQATAGSVIASAQDKGYAPVTGAGYDDFELKTVDARGRGIDRKELAGFAEEKGVTVIEKENSAILKADADQIKAILAYFDLKTDADVTAVEIIFS